MKGQSQNIYIYPGNIITDSKSSKIHRLNCSGLQKSAKAVFSLPNDLNSSTPQKLATHSLYSLMSKAVVTIVWHDFGTFTSVNKNWMHSIIQVKDTS